MATLSIPNEEARQPSLEDSKLGHPAALSHAGQPAVTSQLSAVQAPAPGGSERRPPLPALTGLRTLLALLILLFHFTPGGLSSARFPWLSLYPLVGIGYVFVSFFFLISGFILSYNYAHRPGPISAVDFWMARVSRLYPVYLLAMLISIPMLITEWRVRPHAEFWTGAIATPLLLQGFFPRLATFWNTVSWTLSCEVVLYLAFPVLLRLRWPRHTGVLAALVVGLWLLGMVPHTVYLLTDPDHLKHAADRYDDALWLNTLKYTPAAYLCTFLAGLTLGRLHDAAQFGPRTRVILGLFGFTLAWLAAYHLVPHLPYILVHGGLLTPIWALVILGLAGPSSLASIFSWRPLVAVGSATYALYLLHFNLFVLIHENHWPERLHVTRWDPWISYVAVVLFAVAVRRWVEHPCQLAISKWWKGTRGRVAGRPAHSLTNGPSA